MFLVVHGLNLNARAHLKQRKKHSGLINGATTLLNLSNGMKSGMPIYKMTDIIYSVHQYLLNQVYSILYPTNEGVAQPVK